MGKFRFIDAVLDVAITYKVSPWGTRFERAIKRIILIIGRQADSRRMSPQPWCRFLACDSDSLKPEDIISSYASDLTAKAQEQDSSVFRLDFDEYVIRATVQPKEISGIFYYVLSLLPIRDLADPPNREMRLKGADEIVKSIVPRGPYLI